MFAQDKLCLCYNNDVNVGQTDQYQVYEWILLTFTVAAKQHVNAKIL